MTDLTGLPALDVLIGLAFLFFLLATVAASINEVIQTVLNARARTLTRGLTALLEDPTKARAFLKEWRIERLAKPPGFVRKNMQWLPGVSKRRDPSYIPARVFALTVLDTATGAKNPEVGKDLFEEAKKLVDTIGIPAVQSAATAGITDAQRELDAIRAELERSFDEVMDRASGWYKRYVQWWLLAISLVVAIGLNVNSFSVAERLWKDDALRAAVVQQATAAVEAEEATATAATPQEVADQIDEIEELKLPIGWDDANTKGGFWGSLAGWLITAAAISLGAPFWFDLLGKLARLRSTGNREGTAKDSDRAAEDRDDPSGRR